jgi:DNA-binding PadR family transcriptional regulator
MGQNPSITAETALLRVLINGECDGAELMRKVRDWTDGTIDLDEAGFLAAIEDLQKKALVESQAGATDKRSGQLRQAYVLTPDGQAAAMEILAASLTRDS